MPASSLAGTPAPREAASLVGPPRPTPLRGACPNVVKRADVRMVQAGDRLGFPKLGRHVRECATNSVRINRLTPD